MRHYNSRPSEVARRNVMKRWEGHEQPLGVPYSQHTPEQRKAYQRLMQKKSRAKFRQLNGMDKRAERKPPNPDVSDVYKAMALWK